MSESEFKWAQVHVEMVGRIEAVSELWEREGMEGRAPAACMARIAQILREGNRKLADLKRVAEVTK